MPLTDWGSAYLTGASPAHQPRAGLGGRRVKRTAKPGAYASMRSSYRLLGRRLSLPGGATAAPYLSASRLLCRCRRDVGGRGAALVCRPCARACVPGRSLRMTSLYTAQVPGLGYCPGRIALGYYADFPVFNTRVKYVGVALSTCAATVGPNGLLRATASQRKHCLLVSVPSQGSRLLPILLHGPQRGLLQAICCQFTRLKYAAPFHEAALLHYSID